MGLSRVIFHIDCNSFYAAVECRKDPALKKVPMAVAGDPQDRCGIILAKNEKARAYGVKTAETIFQAKRKCPALVLVPPHYDEYMDVSRQVKRIFFEYTDQVESFGADEAWLDVTGSLRCFHASPVELADAIRQRVKNELSITVSVGVSFNKPFAKLGSDMKKPDGVTLISRENYQKRVWPLAAEELLFVGSASAALLHSHYIHTIGDIAHSQPAYLEQLLGKSGRTLWQYANGLDDTPVRRIGEEEPVKSIGSGMTFRRDLLGWDEMKAGIIVLADEVATRLRSEGLRCMAVNLMIRDAQMKSITRQSRLSSPTHLQKMIAETAMQLLFDNWQEDRPVRALTVTAQHLIEDARVQEQLCILRHDTQLEKYERAETCMQQLRKKYGHTCLVMGFVENESLGIRQFQKAGTEPPVFTRAE